MEAAAELWPQVFRVAQQVGHKLPAADIDSPDPPGFFPACHAEKLLVVALLMIEGESYNFLAEERPLSLDVPCLSAQQVGIIMYQPAAANGTQYCHDCVAFLQHLARNCKTRLRLWSLQADGSEPRHERTLKVAIGLAVAVLSEASVVGTPDIYEPGETATLASDAVEEATSAADKRPGNLLVAKRSSAIAAGQGSSSAALQFWLYGKLALPSADITVHHTDRTYQLIEHIGRIVLEFDLL